MMNAAFRTGFCIGLCVLAVIAMRHDLLTATLAGGFPESDDMMRLVQVRDWLAGQGWSDLRQTRLGPDSSLVMHWTRVIDVPLAGLLLILSSFLSPDTAENWTRVLFPSACLALALLGGLRLGRTLGLIDPKDGSTSASLPLLFALSLALAFTQFQPGRIDHHGPQIALLTFVYHFAFQAFDPLKARSAGLAGLLAALSIAISVETAPLLGAACLGIVARWLWVGAPLAPALRWLGTGLAGGFAAFYLIFAPAGAQAAGACDALSSAWLTAGLAGGASLIALSYVAGSAGRPAARLTGLGIAGAFVLACVGLLHPACLRHPYSGMDPLVVAAWLSKVNEARSLFEVAADIGVRSFLPPVILGSLGLLFAIWSTQGLARARWCGTGALAVVGWGLASYELRALPQLTAICAFGALFAVQASVAWAQARFGLLPAWKFVALLAVFPATWAAVLDRGAPDEAQSISSPPPGSAACFIRGALSAIAYEPPGLTLATIDTGAFVLLNTPHRVLSAPYHRNVAGNKAVIEMFLAEPALAQARAKLAGVRFLTLCPLAADAQALAVMAPDGLAARLLRNETIDWLAPLNDASAPLRIFEARR